MEKIMDVTKGLRFFKKNTVIKIIRKEQIPPQGYIEIPPFTKVKCIFNGGTKYISNNNVVRFTVGEIYNVDKFVSQTSSLYINKECIYSGLAYSHGTNLKQYTGFEPYYENTEMFQLW